MFIENTYIIIYILLWAITLWYQCKHRKNFDSTCILVSSYLFYGINSIILFNSHEYGHYYYGLTLFPFLFLFTIMYATARPIFKFDPLHVTQIQQPSTHLLDTICVIFIITTFLNIPNIVSNIHLLSDIMSNAETGVDLYQDHVLNSSSLKNIGSGISSLSSIISNVLCKINILFFFYKLTQKNKNKFIIYGLLICFIIYILKHLFTGQRGGSFNMISSLVITYFALKTFISKNINIKIKRYGIIALIIVCIPYYYLTYSRHGNKEGGVTADLYTYVGQNNLNFNLYALDDNGIRYGDRCIPIIKKILGFDNVPNNFWERRQKYPHLKINDEVFYTYVGDFTIDFGPVLGALILIFIGLFTSSKTKTRNNVILFHQLILLHLIMCICMEGGMSLFTFADTGNLVIFTYFLLYIIFKIDYFHQIQKLNSKPN